MISLGEEMLRHNVGDRQYADRLEKFGRARCKIALVSSRPEDGLSFAESGSRPKTSTRRA